MLLYELIHPEILAALAAAGHGATVLIADGNYPGSTCVGSRSRVVWLNLAPGIVGCTDVLQTIVSAVPIEAAQVMQPADASRPGIWSEFEKVLAGHTPTVKLQPIERFAFYKAASTENHALTIQTAEQRVYANILLTIGVRRTA